MALLATVSPFSGRAQAECRRTEVAVYHDEVLNDLRRSPEKRLISAPNAEEEQDKKAGKGRYATPRGGLFALVSFPNYLCEWYDFTV